MTTEFPPTDKPEAGYLLKLQLENIRCFAAKQTLDLCAPGTTDRPARWTIILGENGTGKTTLLQVLACGYEDSNSVYVPNPYYRNFYNESKARIFINITDFLYLDLYQNLPQSDTNKNHRTVYTRYSSEYKVFAYGANRRINGLPQAEHQAQRGQETLFSETVGLPNPSQWLLDANVLTNIEGDTEAQAKAKWRYEQIVEALVRLLPGVSAVTIKAVWGRPAVMFKTDFGEVTIEQLSAGYRAMAAWVVDLASHMFNAYPDSADPLSEPAVVLVDEFDLHLHPKWQREAIGFLTERFPAVQFIVTAHSPLVVQSAPDANIVVLKKVGDHVEIENDPVSVKTWRVDQILSSELFGGISPRAEAVEALLQERRALLGKRELTAEERARAAELEALVAEVPHVESAAEIKTMRLMEEITAKLKGGA